MTKTMTTLRAEAKGVKQIESWDDPRLLNLITTLHEHAEKSSYCGTFDSISQELGIPAREVKDYWTITRSGTVEFNGKEIEVTAQVEVFGVVGDEEGTIKEYPAKYNRPFEEAMVMALRKAAMKQITETLDVKLRA